MFKEVGLEGDVSLPQDSPGHVYNQFVIRASNRDGLQSHLKTRGVGTEVYYPVTLHLQECFRSLGYRSGSYPRRDGCSRNPGVARIP